MQKVKCTGLEHCQQISLLLGICGLLLGTWPVVALDRDPTRPVDVDDNFAEEQIAIDIAAEKGPLQLMAIFDYTEQASAVINGVVVKEGDTVAGKMVRQIANQRVELYGEDEIIELTIPSYRLKIQENAKN